MIEYSSVLEKYLYRLARGELSDAVSLLPLVSSSLFYIPTTKSTEKNGLTSYRVEYIQHDGQRYIPTFLHPQPSMGPDFTKVYGMPLLQSLPSDCGLVLEPSTSLELFFPASDLDQISAKALPLVEKQIVEIASDSVANSMANQKGVEDADQPLNTLGELDPSNEVQSGKEVGDQISKVSVEPRTGSSITINDFENVIRGILSRFPSVEEGYALEHSSEFSEFVLGLLVPKWEEDERFQVIDSISASSKELLGYPGAVEVYDDLAETHSKSWDLFKMIPPFYVKGQPEARSANPSVGSTLGGRVTVLTEKNDGDSPDSNKVEDQSGVNKIRESGKRLFSTLVSRR